MRRGKIQLRGRIKWIKNRLVLRRLHGAQVRRRLPIVFGNAIPKSGSKLLFNILRGLSELGPFLDTGLNEIKPYFRNEPTSPSWILGQLRMLKPGDIRFGYLYAASENIEALCQPGWANFFIIRDPRDVVVSEVYYALEINPGHKLHDYFVSLGSIEACISALIQGIPDDEHERVNIQEHYKRFLDWIDRPEICTVRFEELISNPDRELGRILDRLELVGFVPDLPRPQALGILHRQMAPQKSITFRKGTTGQWRQHFTQVNSTQFNEMMGELMVRLGYDL